MPDSIDPGCAGQYGDMGSWDKGQPMKATVDCMLLLMPAVPDLPCLFPGCAGHCFYGLIIPAVPDRLWLPTPAVPESLFFSLGLLHGMVFFAGCAGPCW